MARLVCSGLFATVLGGLPLGTGWAQPAPDQELTLELLQRIEQLEAEVRTLRGDLEVQRHQLERLARVRAAEATPMAAPAASAPVAPAAPLSAVPPAVPPADASRAAAPTAATLSSIPAAPNTSGSSAAPAAPAAVPADYEAALGELREGRYAAAIKGFQQFLAAAPDAEQAGEAQYWLGEAYYLSRNQSAAQEAFINVGLRYPQSERVPDALLKLGYLYGQQGDTAQARTVLEKLIKVYPNTPAAELAQRRLESLR